MPKKPKNKVYFDEMVENAIIRYNNEEDVYKKRQIYNTEIKYAFNKLAENILNTFKFPYIIDTFKNKKTSIVSHLILNINKFSEDKGKGKAFGYFSVIAKNYLIIQNDFNYKNIKVDVPIHIEDESHESSKYISEIEDPNYEIFTSTENYEEFILLIINFFDKNIPVIFNKHRDIEIANSVLILIKEYKSIENFNKKNIYILVRELSNYNSIYITKVINKMKIIYKKLLDYYNIYGDIPSSYSNINTYKK